MKKYDNTNTGAVWKTTSKRGLEYLSGKVNVEGKDYQVAMFINDKKGNEKAPDYRIVIDEPREQGGYSEGGGSGGGVEDIPF